MRIGFSRFIIDKKKSLILIIFASAVLKASYALSRNLFESGPDANGYIPFAVGFAHENFFSPKIMGPPYYPSGYPYLLSLIVRVMPENWFQVAQLLQIITFSVACFLFFYLIEYLFSQRIAGLATLILCFNPAWAVVNGEAMYETLLVSFMIFSIYALVAPLQGANRYSIKSLVLSGIFASSAIVIHPRVLPLFLVMYLAFFFTRIKSMSKRLALIGATLVLPLLFATRNYQAKGSFTLMSSFWAGQTYNEFLNGCTSISCATQRVFSDPMAFLTQSYLNGIRYWSPHSGPLERGTWLHNISFQSFLNSHGYNSLSILISQILSLLVFLAWIYGSVILHKKNVFFNTLFLFLAGIIWITDILVYGENRHRLIALIFMLPAQASCILSLLKKVHFLKSYA